MNIYVIAAWTHMSAGRPEWTWGGSQAAIRACSDLSPASVADQVWATPRARWINGLGAQQGQREGHCSGVRPPEGSP